MTAIPLSEDHCFHKKRRVRSVISSERHIPDLEVRVLTRGYQLVGTEPSQSRDLTLRMSLCEHVAKQETAVSMGYHRVTLTFVGDVFGWIAGIPDDDSCVQTAGRQVHGVRSPGQAVDARHVEAPLQLMCELQ